MLGSIGKVAGGLFGYNKIGQGVDEAKKLAQFKPWNVDSPFANVKFEDGTVKTGLSSDMQGLVSQLFSQLSQTGDPQSLYNTMNMLSAQDQMDQQMSLENRLFSQGRLGSTGGMMAQRAMQDGFGRERLQRELAATTTSSNLFSQGLQNILGINAMAMQPAQLGTSIGLGMANVGAALAPSIIGGRTDQAGIGGSAISGFGEGLEDMFKGLFKLGG